MTAPATWPAARQLAFGTALLGVLAACGGDRPGSSLAGEDREALVERLIAEDPQILLDRDGLFDNQPVFVWKFATEEDLAPWQTRGLASARLHRRRWLLQAAGDDPQLERRLELDAEALHLVEVNLIGLARGEATLFWAGPGEPFAEDRSLTVGPPAQRRRAPFTLTFDLAGHRLWRGAVERLRLDPTDAAEDAV